MPRPFRPQWVARSYARHSHRTWMRSMALASAGWCAWWIFLFAHHFAPHLTPAFWVLTAVSTFCAAPGLLLALWCLRARRAWLYFAAIPVIANASLLAAPWVARHYLSS